METDSQTTIALIVFKDDSGPVLQETLTAAEEILEFELALLQKDPEPLERVFDLRRKQAQEEEKFADFVEGLLSQPALKADVQEHAVKWFKSRVKIESYQKAEQEASKVIAQYAFEIFKSDQEKTDFILAGPNAKVRVRIFETRHSHGTMAA